MNQVLKKIPRAKNLKKIVDILGEKMMINQKAKKSLELIIY